MRYVAVCGGVINGLGKGITISSIGRLLKQCGLRVTAIKIDPYVETDAGTMSQFEHGEVFVLNDGGEVDLDLGNYERFLSITLTRDHNLTTGKVYNAVIAKERKGDYLGKTVQVVPHITDEIQAWIERAAMIPIDDSGEPADVCLIEVGGTVGDIESSVFLEALRQFQFRVKRENFCLIFISIIPFLGNDCEQKAKTTQHGVKELRAVGLSPDIIICRSKDPIEFRSREKISVFCHVRPSHVLCIYEVSNIYHVPLILADQGLHLNLMEQLHLEGRILLSPKLDEWRALADAVDHFTTSVKIALVGKYTGLQDSYLSVMKSLKHAAITASCNLEIVWIEASDLEEDMKEEDEDRYEKAWKLLTEVDGIIVPGGFGTRGIEGKIQTVRYAREFKKPILGVCLGMQVMVIEYARSKLGYQDATSEEFCDRKDPPPVIMFMPEIDPKIMGGTMRLGARPTNLESVIFSPTGKQQRTLSIALYKNQSQIAERHRHRYEVNPNIVADLEEAGLHFVGRDESGIRMEIIELARDVHPFFMGTQFHPEFNSRPLHPSPPFVGLLLAATNQLDSFLENSRVNVNQHEHLREKERSANNISLSTSTIGTSRIPLPVPVRKEMVMSNTNSIINEQNNLVDN